MKRLAGQFNKYKIDFEISKAIDGIELQPPTWWKMGFGAWGVMRSHIRILEDAWINRWDRIAIFEDDAILIDGFDVLLDEFMEELPMDWDQIYLGGQPRKGALVSPRVSRPVSANRAHGYCFKRSVIPIVLRHLHEVDDFIKKQYHFDTRLEDAQRRNVWRIYAPSWLLVGQGGEFSRITMSKKRDFWWDTSFNKCHLKLPIFINAKDNPRLLSYASPFASISNDKSAMKKKIMTMQRESYVSRMLPNVVNISDANKNWMKRLFGDLIINEPSDGDMDRLIDYPRNNLFKHEWMNNHE